MSGRILLCVPFFFFLLFSFLHPEITLCYFGRLWWMSALILPVPRASSTRPKQTSNYTFEMNQVLRKRPPSCVRSHTPFAWVTRSLCLFVRGGGRGMLRGPYIRLFIFLFLTLSRVCRSLRLDSSLTREFRGASPTPFHPPGRPPPWLDSVATERSWSGADSPEGCRAGHQANWHI